VLICVAAACSTNNTAVLPDVAAVNQDDGSEVFYIIGEDGSPVPYPYVEGMQLTTACAMTATAPAMAGGFTYRAVEDECVITRDGKEIHGGPETPVLPGDVIKTKVRFF
jgi:protein involved in polysaccharide export with SLBB domain